MEEDLQKIIKLLCQEYNENAFDVDVFRKICSDVIKSVYKIDILINSEFEFTTGDDNELLVYIFKTNIVSYNSYGNKVLVKINCQIYRNKQTKVVIENIQINE